MITVVDSIMGSGKSIWAINHMNANPFSKYLYISPFKDEDNRIKRECPGLHFYVPEDDNKRPKFPRVKSALSRGDNIASTHELFKMFDEDCVSLIMNQGYTLILDEVLEIMNPLEMRRSDIAILENSEATIVNDECKMVWTDKYVDLSNKGLGWLEDMVKLGKVINIDGTALFWQFPPDIFTAFKDVYVLTYLFESNPMKSYFDINEITYTKKSIKDSKLVDFYVPDLSPQKELINIYEGKLNTNIYQTDTTFSVNWYSKDSNKIYIDKMRNNLFNWFCHISNSSATDRMWTCFKDNKDTLGTKGYKRSFVFHNCRATNEFRDKSCLAYCVNRFHNPMLQKYFTYMKASLNSDLFALSEMIQWIWRSRIRDGYPIQLYIPSDRMRHLLQNWLNNNIEVYR